MTTQNTLPPRDGTSFADQPHAYDPVRQPQPFQGVIGRRVLAFIVDAIIIAVLWIIAVVVVALLGISRLAWRGSCSAWCFRRSASATTR